jgi:uncharacterized protein (TIGR00369 family)
MVLRLLSEARRPSAKVIFVPGKLVTLVVHRELVQREPSLESKSTQTDRKEKAMTPPDPDYVMRVRTSFGRQQAMALLGAQMTEVRPGVTEIVLPFREELTQQHGFVHAGIITAIVDSACGYAALSLMPPDSGVLTIEFKVNLLSPAAGERFVARGQVVKPGRTIMVCTGEVVAERTDGTRQTVALMQATMMVVRDRAAVSD